MRSTTPGWWYLFFLCICAGGCASQWEANFERNEIWNSVTFSPTASVEVREIPFERYQSYVNAERERRIQSTTAPQDQSSEERLAEKNRLLEALQIRSRGDSVIVIGWSQFTDTARLSRTDPNLEKFARRIGADTVVLTSTFTGLVTQLESVPITTRSSGFTTYTRGRVGEQRRAPAGTVSYSDQTTSWVPVQVTRDQFFYAAYFLRHRQAGDPQTEIMGNGG